MPRAPTHTDDEIQSTIERLVEGEPDRRRALDNLSRNAVVDALGPHPVWIPTKPATDAAGARAGDRDVGANDEAQRARDPSPNRRPGQPWPRRRDHQAGALGAGGSL